MVLGPDLLRTWRGERTQREAAQVLGLDQGRYSQYENAKRRPGRFWAVKIAAATGGAVPIESWDMPARCERLATEQKAS